jgi:hypothetical protein
MELETFLHTSCHQPPHINDRLLISNLFDKNLQKPPKRTRSKRFSTGRLKKLAGGVCWLHRGQLVEFEKGTVGALFQTDTLEDTS